MFRTHRVILAGLLSVLAGATCMTGVASAAPWTKQATVNPLTGPSDWNTFNAVTRPATHDGWAGGYRINWPTPDRYQILLEHWNGTTWTVHATPKTLGPDTEIEGMSGTARNDVWAVGTTGDLFADSYETFAMHWNGSAWKLIPTPGFPLTELGVLQSVAARSTSDAWASGGVDGAGLLEHWNGSTWSTVAGAPGSAYLSGVATAAHGVVWAVGSSFDPNTGATTTFAEHRVNGTWVRTPTPNPLDTQGEDVNELHSVTALSRNNAWAVGMVGNEDAEIPYRPLILHWNGTAWHRVSAPSPDTGGDPLFAVLARSAKDVWAVGYGGKTITTSDTHAVVEHWNGTKWTESSIGPSFLGSLAMNPTNGQLWAAGYRSTNDHVNTLLVAHS
jgi:hypothetical protein